MLEYQNLNNKMVKKIGNLVLSYIDHYNIKLGTGLELATNTGMVFSHGRGGTPLVYSSFLIHYAGVGFKVGSVQHTEVQRTGLSGREEIKRFREREVQARAAECYQAVLKVNK